MDQGARRGAHTLPCKGAAAGALVLTSGHRTGSSLPFLINLSLWLPWGSGPEGPQEIVTPTVAEVTMMALEALVDGERNERPGIEGRAALGPCYRWGQ